MIPESYIEELQWFSESLKNTLKPESPQDVQIVQKGLILYRQRSVSNIIFKKDAITGVVHDVSPVNVKLDLSIPYLSECSCPADDTCRHQIAVFFHILARGGSVSQWMDDWRKPLKEQKQAQTFGLMKAKDLLKTTGQLKPDYQQWTNTFRESFDTIVLVTETHKPYLISELFSVYLRRLHAGTPFKPEWKNLYLLISYVISFRQLLKLSIELGHNEETINRYYRHLFQNMLDEIEVLSSRMSVQSLPFAFDGFIEQLKDETIPIITEDFPIEFERIYLFRTLWTHIFKQKNWREEARNELAAIPDINLPTAVSLIHLHILLREDKEALDLIQACSAEISPYFFAWFELLDINRMEPYVNEFIQLIKPFLSLQQDYYLSREFMRDALHVIRPFCTEKGRQDLYEKALVQLLPHSFYQYEIFLFDQQEYERWLELHTYAGQDFYMISKDRLTTLKKEAPTLLLPLYHQAIQKDIEGKNRDYYREAVRKLKKLRTIYKQLKRTDEWERFFELLLTNTKRLRAFQEECKRGKLINA